MAYSSRKRRGRAVVIVAVCVLAVCLIAAATLYALLNRRLTALQQGAQFNFAYDITSTAAEAPTLYSIAKELGGTQGSVTGSYAAPGKLQLSLSAAKASEPFTRVYIDQNETLYDVRQVYDTVCKAVSDASSLAAAFLPSWELGDYISQTQLAAVLGVDLGEVSMQDMSNFTLVLAALKRVEPEHALAGYTYFALPVAEDGTSLTLGLPLKQLFDQTTQLHIMLSIPTHGVDVELKGTLTAAETVVTAPTSRMKDEDIDRFVQIRQSIEGLLQTLESLTGSAPLASSAA